MLTLSVDLQHVKKVSCEAVQEFARKLNFCCFSREETRTSCKT
jgi:hypothetical protein